MAAITHNKHNEFHWTPASLTLSVLLGIAATVGLWLGTGLLIMLFLL